MMTTSYLLLGSNEGDAAAQLQLAIQQLELLVGEVTSLSCVYATAPWGHIDQPDFLNQAVAVQTPLSAMELLHTIKQIEIAMGRVASIKWGQRLIDIDILLYGDLVLTSEYLIVPHPHLPIRRFALIPLCDIAGQVVHPVLHCSISQLLFDCPDKSVVTGV
jgi:2-amino-4-hydroxy-6-hydroxymethyldihydropteridine diphosphokinase